MKKKINFTKIFLILSIVVIVAYLIAGNRTTKVRGRDTFSDATSDTEESSSIKGSFGMGYISEDDLSEDTDEEPVVDEELADEPVEESSEEPVDEVSPTGITASNYLDEIKAILECNYESSNIDETYKESLESNPVINPFEYEVTNITIDEDNSSFDDNIVSVLLSMPEDTKIIKYRFSLNFENKISKIEEA